MHLDFEWDEEKNGRNFKKHGIRFEEAALIFREPTLTTVDDRKDYGETRETSIGQLGGRVYLVVVHTDREGITRLISARRAKRQERKEYDDYIKKDTG